MKFQFILGGCGAGKSHTLMQNIKTDLQAGNSAVMIVPQQFSFEAEKRLYDFLDAELFNRMKVYSFETLSKDILLKYGSAGRSYATEQENLLFLYQTIQECNQRNALKVLGRQNHPEALENLQKLVTKMRIEGITAEKMLDISPAFADSALLRDKTQDIAEILGAYDRILQDKGLCDNLNNLTSAVRLAEKHGFFRKQNVYIDEFGIFSGDQYQMLDVILHQAESFSIAIRADMPSAKPSGIFMGGNQTFLNLKQKAQEIHPDAVRIQYCPQYVRSAHADLKAVSEQIFRSGKTETPYQNHVHIFQADDPVSEIEYICATVYHLLEEHPKLHFRDIAIAVKEPDIYRPLLERAFARYGMPYDIAAEKSVLHTELIRYFLILLEILSSDRWDTETLLKYFKNPFSGYDSEIIPMLEHFCFTWSIRKENWETHFYEEGNPELNQRSEEFGGQAIEEVRSRCITELKTLKALCKDADIRKICRLLYRHLDEKKNAYEAKISDVLKQNEFTTLWKLLGSTMNTVVRNMGAEKMPLKEIHKLFLMLLKNSGFSTPP
ncbi:MAG: exodeoxyribonuclease V subunit gamma, partial [Oscillospiraceae bacterium]|nr:exodeoxyribonuclease V subunit gamma [Oscillospiraceae bacterium]